MATSSFSFYDVGFASGQVSLVISSYTDQLFCSSHFHHLIGFDLFLAVGKSRSEADTKVIRNREAAQQFRQRQREHMLVLQAEHDRLIAENRAFQEHMSRLRAQKEDLDKDLLYARSFLEHTMSIAMANLRHSNRMDLLEPVPARA